MGLLVDKKGRDTYRAEGGMSQGYGTPPPAGAHSLGVLIDEEGGDSYSGSDGKDGSSWVRGKAGVGLDLAR
jgi:hypothetical protein